MREELAKIEKTKRLLRGFSLAMSIVGLACIACTVLYFFGILNAQGAASAVLGIYSEEDSSFYTGVYTLLVSGLITVVVGIFGHEIGSGNERTGIALWLFLLCAFCEVFTVVNGLLGARMYTFAIVCAVLSIVGLVLMVRMLLQRRAAKKAEERERAARTRAAGNYARGSRRNGTANTSATRNVYNSGPNRAARRRKQKAGRGKHSM